MKEAVHAALEAGYRHIDTAYVYKNEAAIGEVIQEWIKSGKLKREELFVTTKVSLRVPQVYLTEKSWLIHKLRSDNKPNKS